MGKQAIILVAGMGTRLRPLTNNTHKCLTEVNGITILENTLNILDELGFTNAVLVVGYLKEKIQSAIGKKYKRINIDYVYNEKYDQTNTSYSLKLGIESVDTKKEVYIFEGDVFFEKKILEKCINIKEKNIAVVEPYNEKLSGTFVGLSADNNYIVEWKHKSMQADDFNIKTKYKTVNIHKWSCEFVHNYMLPQLDINIKEKGGMDPLEYIMDQIVEKNHQLIAPLILKGDRWYEIDDVVDLNYAEKMFANY